MFKFLRKLFATKRKEYLPKHSNNQKKIKTFSDSKQNLKEPQKITPKITNNSQNNEVAVNSKKTSVAVKQPALIFEKYVDTDGNEIFPETIIKTFVGDRINIDIPKINDYLFKNIYGISSFVTASKQFIIFEFTKKIGKPVMIYYFNFDDNNLLKTPEFVTGKIGEAYSIKKTNIKGFKLHLSVGNLTGTFDDQTKNIIFYYRKDNWQLVQPVNYLVKVKVDTKVYATPTEQKLYKIKLPRNSIWKIFKEIKTTNGIWLSLGGAEWIKADYVVKIHDNQLKLDK